MPNPGLNWDHELLLEIAARENIRRLVQLSREYSRATNQSVKPGTLSQYLYRNPELREKVQESMNHYEQLDHPDEIKVDSPEAVKSARNEATIRELRRQNETYRKALAQQEEFFDRIIAATNRPVPIPKYRLKKQSKDKPGRSVVLPIFDQQYGQFVRADDTSGNRGEFNVAIFDERLTRWVEGATGILTQYGSAYRIDELVMCLGGDHVEGDEIFPGQPWQLEVDPAVQTWDLGVKMDDALRKVIQFAREEIGIPWISCYGVTGNHGKVGGKRGGARPTTYNWDWLFLKYLLDENGGRLYDVLDEAVIEPGGSLFFRCAGHEFQLVHGDEIRGWGGLPFYGLAKFDGRSMRLHNRIYRYLLMGHHHQPGEVPNGAGETLISGDWVGPNNMSKMMTAGSRPQQRVLFVSEKWGVTGGERIYFTDAHEQYEPTTIYGR